MNEIKKFIASLNDNQKKLLVIAVVIVIAALFDRILIGPTMSSLSSVQESITKEQVMIKQDMRFLGYKDRILAESKEIAPYLAKNKLTDNEIIAAFLNKIQNLAGQANVNLIKINPAPVEQDAEYWKYQADLECSGSLGQVITFMHLVNTGKDLMKVDKFNITAQQSNTGEIRAAMTIEKIVVTDKSMPAHVQDTNIPNVP